MDPARESPGPPPGIYGIVAREQPICVLFRRGPSPLVQVVRWNTATSEVMKGQWFRGRIYEARGDLSPDGTLMSYFAAKRGNPDPTKHTWTAISRPPYLTALALWFKGDSWGGGALFESNECILLNDPEWMCQQPFVLDPDHPCPLESTPLEAPRGEDWPIERIRLERDGWIFEDQPKLSILTKKQGLFSIVRRYAHRGRHYEIHRADGAMNPLDRIQWADIDCDGRMVAARDGELLVGSLEGAWTNDLEVVCDLTSDTFESVVAPEWASSW